jgi:cellulose synthase/poly-beta-1,6-N-acetylglucosamine synthase-like glycosyltransferase
MTLINILTMFFITIYSVCSISIFFFSLIQLDLFFNYKRSKTKAKNIILTKFKNLPFVTVQLPIYNEKNVIKRLLDAVVKIDYPSDKIEIQVLDDSDDNSTIYIKNLISQLKSKTNLKINHITRNNRDGFKAGALKYGLKLAKGNYIAIFDADFIPRSDWLKKTICGFKDSKIGVVQTKWDHINKNFSLLTKIQAFALDIHFTLEQVGRNFNNYFLNFNGTAGIWRKEAILNSGNWNGDTLTEDLDLSYRAQLTGWRIKYMESIDAPAEIPFLISAIKSQQFRWNKGGAENLKKHFLNILKNNNLKFSTKVHCVFHLFSSSIFLSVFLLSFLSVPLAYLSNVTYKFNWFFNISSLFVISTIIFFFVYWELFKLVNKKKNNSFFEYTKLFISFYSISGAFAFQNSVAVLQGFIGKKTEFVRTPKFNLTSGETNLEEKKYVNESKSYYFIIEGFLALYFLSSIITTILFASRNFGFLPFHLFLFFGYTYIFVCSLRKLISEGK